MLLTVVYKLKGAFVLEILRVLDVLCHSVDFVHIQIVHQIWGHKSLLVLLLHRLDLNIFLVDTVMHKYVIGILVLRGLKLRDGNLRFWHKATLLLFGLHYFFFHFNNISTKQYGTLSQLFLLLFLVCYL